MNTFQEIDSQAAHALMATGEATVIDIRDEDSFRHSSIQGALQLTDETIKDFLAQADRQKPLICYCYHGISSRSAASFFIAQGFQKVFSLTGGYEEWQKNYAI